MNSLLNMMNLFSLGGGGVSGGGSIAGFSPSVPITGPSVASPPPASINPGGSKLGQAYLALNGLSSLSTLASGFSNMISTGNEAQRLNMQANIALQEARTEAIQTASSVKSFREQQASGYLNSGVTLEGSPMENLTRTLVKGQEEIDAIQRHGAAQAKLYRLQASQTRRGGLLSVGTTGLAAGVNFGTAVLQAKRLGAFGNTAPSIQGGP